MLSLGYIFMRGDMEGLLLRLLYLKWHVPEPELDPRDSDLWRPHPALRDKGFAGFNHRNEND